MSVDTKEPELERLRRVNQLLADQLQASAYTDKDFAQALQLLARWLGKFKLENPWPCGECGRKGPDAPLLTKDVIRTDGARHTEGCTLCNVYDLVNATDAFIQTE